MTPLRLKECLISLRWSSSTLADALGCQEELVDAWILGFEGTPPKAAAWIEALAQVHDGMETLKPKSLIGKQYKGQPET